MKRIRVAAIIIKNKKILLMERKKEGEHYWVFPGGKYEKDKDKTIVGALIREIIEEANIFILPCSLPFEVNQGTKQDEVYYECRYLSGKVKLPKNSIEQERITKEGQFYKPAWVPVNDLHNYNLLPIPIRDAVVENFSQN